MNTSLQMVINSANSLSPLEQWEVFKTIGESLFQNGLVQLPAWQPKPLAELLQNQPTPSVTTLATLAAECWPPEESADDIIEYLYQQRPDDRLA